MSLLWRGSKDIKIAVKRFFESEEVLDGKIAIDIPAGEGVTSEILRKRGAQVMPLDLFPEFFKVSGLECKKGDLGKLPLDIPDRAVDLLVCQEGIEHMSDQMSVLREFNRLLKPGGKLYITTPSYSHLRSKISYLIFESELYKSLPANEIDDVWFSKAGDVYYGHIFVVGIQKLRTMAVLSGFEISRLLPVRVNYTSVFLGLFFYPFILFFSFFAYFRNLRKQKNVNSERLKKVYWEILKLNISPYILFGAHTFVEFKKVQEIGDSVIQEKTNFRAPLQQQEMLRDS